MSQCLAGARDQLVAVVVKVFNREETNNATEQTDYLHPPEEWAIEKNASLCVC